MRVLHITPGLAERVGGPPQVAVGLCKGLAKAGVDVTLYTTNFDYEGTLDVPIGVPIEQDGFRTYYFNVKSPKRFIFSPELGRAVRGTISHFDLVHIHGLWLYTNLIGAYFAQRKKVPYVVRPRGNLTRLALAQNWWLKQLYRWVIEGRNLNKAAALHCVGANEFKEVQKLGYGGTVVMVPNGVDLIAEGELSRCRGTFREAHPETAGKRLVLFVGRISPLKGLDRLCDAFALLARDLEDVHLAIVGCDNEGYMGRLRKPLRTCGVAHRVTFTGFLRGPEKIAALADADIFCMPSYQDVGAIALREAMVCGLPAVVSREVASDLPERIRSQGCCVDRKGTSAGLAAALSRVLENRKDAERIAKSAKQLMMEKYTWDAIAHCMMDVYERIVGLSTGPYES
ncbi:MAG: glycosyltransferase [Candidatus Methylomirabilales bacterium]